MIILGLGSNIGDRLANLRQALQRIKKIAGVTVTGISPVYLSDALLPEVAPDDWDMPYLNAAIKCETTLTPDDLLKELKNIEWSVGRKPIARHWGPRILDIDILVWDDLLLETETLTIPHPHLFDRPFAAWPLADIAPFWRCPSLGKNHAKTAAEIVLKWGSRFDGNAPLQTRQIYQRIESPVLVGIINVTPDSFSDGGEFIAAEKALVQAKKLMQDGAEVLDIGAESTAPHTAPVDENTEWARLEPVLMAIQSAKKDFLLPPKMSVDTRHVAVAKKALDLKIDWLNDVSGLEDLAMRELIAHTKADCVVMHHVSIPASKNHIIPLDQEVTKIVYEWGAKKIEQLIQSGISLEKIIFDPGIGFGKAPEQSLQLIKDSAQFKKLGARLLIGHSRKSFLSLFTPYPASERDIETMAISLLLAQQPIDYLRIHHIEAQARALKVWRAW